jgi:hypothetical protein
MSEFSFLRWPTRLKNWRWGSSPARSNRSAKVGRRPRLEELEDRTVPALTPAQVVQAYGINHISFGGIVGNGAGQTIAIIDPGDDAALVNTGSAGFNNSDLHQFDVLTGLADPPSFTVVGQTGGARPTYIGIQSATVSGTTVTVNTSSADGLSVGNTVTIAETGNLGIDGSYKVVSTPTSTSFKYTDNNSGLANVSTGTINNPVSTGETTLDVEWAHAIAPGAKIILIELTSFSEANIAIGEKTASTIGASVVSMSYSRGEDAHDVDTDPQNDSNFITPGVTYIASTGDNGAPGGYPAFSPNVLAVGGTNLVVNSDGSYQSETAWSNPVITSAVESGSTVTITTSATTPTNFGRGTAITVTGVGVAGYNGSFTIKAILSSTSFTYTDGTTGLLNSSGGTVTGGNNGGGGGSISASIEPQPAYQQGTVTKVTQSSTFRTIPDVAFVGGEPTPVLTYDSDGIGGAFSNGNTFNTWGTSVSAPCFAGLIAIADQGLALRSQPLLNSSTSLQTALYDLPLTDFHDITSGNNGNAAGAGYDLVTGIGSPVANLLVPDLAGQPAQLVYNAPDNTPNHNILVEQVGTNIDVFDNGVLVTAHPVSTTSQIDINGSDASGTIHLTVDYSGGQFTIPVNYNGGTGGGSHTMTIQGGSFTNEVDSPTGPHSGTITLDGETITYSKLQPITDTSSATNFTIHDPQAGDIINIVDDPGSPENGFQSTQVNGGGLELVNFANKTNVKIDNTSGSGGDTFNVNDPNSAAGLASLSLLAGGNGDTFDVMAALASGASLSITGSGGNNALNGPNQADVWDITSVNGGSIAGVVASFTDIQNVGGGSVQDVFAFQGGRLTGKITGGSGFEWLDYSAVTNAVNVNLATGAVTLVNSGGVGGVTNVNNVIGSSTGGDKITGDSAGGYLEAHNGGNSVTAGSGRSVIVGGFGVSLLQGGLADDLIIGGKTIFDGDGNANIVAKDAILTEWLSSAGFPARVAALKSGVVDGDGNTDRLILSTTVFCTGTAPGPRFGRGGGNGQSTMLGNGGRNWFFTLYPSVIVDLKSTDQVN